MINKDIWKQDYNVIVVSRKAKIFGIPFWIRICTVYRNPMDESLALYHRTRDHYLNLWGRDNVSLEVRYPSWTQIH